MAVPYNLLEIDQVSGSSDFSWNIPQRFVIACFCHAICTFRVNLHSIVAWISRNSFLKIVAISDSCFGFKSCCETKFLWILVGLQSFDFNCEHDCNSPLGKVLLWEGKIHKYQYWMNLVCSYFSTNTFELSTYFFYNIALFLVHGYH